jgi:hypothetical protein
VTFGPSQPVFSHRNHLAPTGLTCVTCHGSALESASSEDDNRPPSRACTGCHGERYGEQARSSPRPQRTYRFNHKLHLGFGNLAPLLASAIDRGSYLGDGASLRPLLETGEPCLACHRGVKQADLATSDQLPRMADCLVCHSNVDPPFSCGFCHTQDAVLQPPSHTKDFADRHSRPAEVPDKSGCKVCHGRRFTCMGCH